MFVDGSEEQLVRTTIVRDCPNRFRVVVLIEGQDEYCYVPLSSKLSKSVGVEGRDVLVSEKTMGSTRFRLEAIRIGEYWSLLAPQKITNLLSRYISETSDIVDLEHEISVADGYRADFVSRRSSPRVWETKTVLVDGPDATYPVSRMRRAERQLVEMTRLVRKGYEVNLLFVFLNAQTTRIVLNPKFPDFKEYLQEFLAVGGRVGFCAIEDMNGSYRCRPASGSLDVPWST